MIRRPNRSEDDFTEEETAQERPARASRRNVGPFDDDEDEAEAPVRRNRVSRDEDEDEGEAPTPARRVVRSGWAGAESLKSKKSGANYAQNLKLSEEPVLVKFLEDAPYAAYLQHWVDRTGQRAFVCIDDSDPKGCPLCEAGIRPSQRFSFNVVLLTPGSDPEVKSYDVGPRVLDQLKNFNNDSRQGPLSKHYWAISRTGKGTTSATNHQMVRERDLEDFDVDPLSESDLKTFTRQAYTEEIIKIPTHKDLLAVAEELS